MTLRHNKEYHLVFMLAIVVVAGGQFLAFATHERDHRFTIFGTVRDGSRFPGIRLPNQTVVVLDAETRQEMRRATTDAEGKYTVVLHVHDSDVGKLVMLQSSGVSKELRLKFEPGNIETERRAQVDIVVFPQSTPLGSTPSK